MCLPVPCWRVALPLSGTLLALCAGMRLKYTEWGDGQDTLLLLHDVAESAAVWAPVALRLADRGFHVIAFDLRGAQMPCNTTNSHTHCKQAAGYK